jgi:hypothetical protein
MFCTAIVESEILNCNVITILEKNLGLLVVFFY